MAISKRPDRRNREAEIQKKQQEIDAYDEKLDSKIDIGESSEEKETLLTQTYIKKVNELQGRLNGLRKKIEVQKDMRADNWPELEKACNEVEAGLFEHLQDINKKNLVIRRENFDAALNIFIESVESHESGISSPESAEKEKGSPTPGAELLKELGLPDNEETDKKLESLTKEQERKIRTAHANLKFLEKVPDGIHETLFGTSSVLLSAEKGKTSFISVLLLNDKLEGSDYGYLLDNPEKKVSAVRENAKDKSRKLVTKIEGLRDEEENMIKIICKETGGNEYNLLDIFTDKIEHQSESIQAGIDSIKKTRAKISKVEEEKYPIDAIVLKLDLALGAHHAYEAKNEGREEEGNRALLRLWDEHGSDVKKVDSDLWREMGKASGELRRNGKFTEFEEKFYSNDASYSDKMAEAIEQKSEVSTAVDIADQVRAKETFVIDKMKLTADRWRYIPEYRGRIQNHLKNHHIANLQYRHGESLEVMLSPSAKSALDALPEDARPVLLRPVKSMNVIYHHAGRPRPTFANQPREFVVQGYEIGYVLNGEVFQSGAGKIDTKTHEHGKHIESQLHTRRGFDVKKYVRTSFLTHGSENETYKNDLYSIRTQSGKEVKGVQISDEAKAFMDEEPPEGMTTVLKRVPKDITLSAGFSIPGKTGGRKRVLATDTIQIDDLAHARVEGSELVMQHAGPKGEEAREDLRESDKSRNEKARDVLRVLNRDPAINRMKSAAVSIDSTVNRLQSFLQAKDMGSARENFIKFAQDEAAPMRDLFKNPKTKSDLEDTRQQLHQLKEAGSGVALGGVEKEIDAQIKAIDGFIKMLDNPQTLNFLETITDESKFSADNWENFFKNELPMIVGAILVATACVVTVIATCGTAAPMWAIAASGAVGGIVGSELASEAVHYSHRWFNSDVKSGKTTFSRRSKLGKLGAGKEIYNPETGKYEKIKLVNVATEYGKEFAFSFAITYGTLGLGQIAGSGLSKILQNQKVMESMAKHTTLRFVARQLVRINTNPETLGRARGLKEICKRFMNGMPKETLEEFSDEMQENILEKALTSMSASLSVMEGHQGKIGWGNVGAVFLAGIKCTRLGKSRTRTYPVSVDGRSESIAQTSAEIRSDAESRGAIVTDFGGGVLSIQHQAVDANGDPTGEYVTEQFRPLTKKEMKKLDRQAQEHEMSQDVEEKMQRERDATLEMAQEVEGLQDLDPESKLADAIFEAHSVEPTGVREDGSKYYTAQDIAEKARIVQEAMQPDDGSKLTPEQRAKNKKIREDLIRGRILGNPEFMVDSEEVLTGSEGLRALLKEYGIYQGFTADEALHELIIKRANSTEPLSVDHKRQAEEVYRWTLTLAYPETVRKFQEVFDISNERAHEIAVEYANNAYQEETRLFQEGGEYKHLHTSMLDNKLHKLIEDHGVSIDEIDGVREDATSLCDGIGNAVGMDTINSRMGEWRRKQGDAGKDKIVDYQLRAAVAEAVRRGDSKLLLNLESAIETQQKSSIYLNQLAIEINLHSEEEGSVLDLSLDTNNKMLWRKLYRRGGKEKAAAMSELKKCLNSFGLNPDRVTRAIENASTTEAEIRQAPDEYNEDYVYEGVAMRIVDNITTLESEVKGAVKHFHEKRGINLFNRYPTEILTEIYEQETGKAAPGMKIKGHMLILDPESDYNGAFETPDQIRKIAKEAKDKGFALHIAESGTRYSRYRQLVRCRREFGPLHHAVIGGHTSESQIMQLGPNPEDVITGKELQNLIKKKKKNKLSEKEQKLLNKIKEFFDPDAVIYFKACSSGLAGGIADRSSDLINVRTVGPESPTNIKTIRLDLGEVEFHKGIAAKMYFPSAEKQAEYEAAVESTAQRAELMELAQAARYGKPEQLRARLEAGPEIDPQMHSDLIREVAFDEYTVFSEEEKQMLDNGNIYDVIISQRLKGARKDTADDADHSYARYRMRDLADSGLITAEDAEHDLNLTSESETSESTVEDAETDSETVVDADLETQCTRCRERLSKTDAELRERFMQEKAVIELEGDPAAQKKMIESRIKAYRDSVDMISSPEIQRRTRKVFETKFGKVEMSPEAEQRLMDHINELALEQQLDNPEQYVSHGFDHSLNVMDQIERTVEMNPKIAEYMQNMYGLSAAESAFMLKMVGVFHDFGYPELGKRGDGGLGKALHAATGAEIAANPELRAMMREALKVGEADGISEAQFEKLMHDFRDSILYHSADKVEVFRDTKIKLGHGEFIVDSENIVDIFTEYYAENQQTEAITIQCSEEVEAKIRERLGPEGVGDIKFERPNERDLTMHEGQQRFRGRSVDLSTGKDEMLGIQYKEVGVDEDPMNFIIRLTDNCDMTPERFSALQRTEAFSSLYRKLFPFEGQIPPTGQVMEVLEQKTADTRAILDEFAECQRSLNSPELDAIVKRVQNGESVSAKELRNAFKSAVIDKVMIENHDELVTTAQRLGIDPEIFATKFRKIGMSQNTQTMRHFGGCEPVQSVDLQERTGYPGEMELSVTVDRETYERLNRETVQEKSSDTDGSSVVVNVSLGDYQIWRAYEAFRSLRQPGGKPIRIVVRDQNGQPMHGEGTDFESHFQAQNELPPS